MNSSTITLRHYDTIMNTPALPLAVRGWHELLDEALTDLSSLLVAPGHSGIVAFEKDEPVGVLTWFDHADGNQLFVVLAYVRPMWRQQGIHTRLFAEVVTRAQRLNRPSISSGFHVENNASLLAHFRQGRERIGYLTRFEVSKPSPGGTCSTLQGDDPQ